MDIQTIFKFVTDYGLMPVLFIVAFYHIITEAKNREKSQRDLYEKLSEEVEEMNKSIHVIEESIKRIDQNMANTVSVTSNVEKEVTHLKYIVSSLESRIEMSKK